MRAVVFTLAVGAVILGQPVQPVARAADAVADAATERGRLAYQRGVKLTEQQQWGDALAAFEESVAAHDHPVARLNIATCERALGRYVEARQTALALVTHPAGLDAAKLQVAKDYLAEFEKLIVHVAVQLDPPNAVLTVDGRPLAPGEAEGSYLGGVAPAGAGSPVATPAFTVILDPGAHIFRAARTGHQDALIPRSYGPGETASLDLHLDVLPATISIRSEPQSAIVRVNARDVGVAPIEFQRPAGQYKLEVVHDDYEIYKAAIDLEPGQRADMTARLNPYKAPLTKKWWFWSGAVAIVAGGAVLTYFLTRPSPQPPPYDSGSANWLVKGQSFSW